MRYAFALNMRPLDKTRCVCVDESSMQTYRYGLYHMRKISSNPKANCTYKRNIETVNMWLGLSYFGCTPCVVSYCHHLNTHKKCVH